MDNRDDDIISEYRPGKEPDEIARANGLSGRKVNHILSENAIILLRCP